MDGWLIFMLGSIYKNRAVKVQDSNDTCSVHITKKKMWGEKLKLCFKPAIVAIWLLSVQFVSECTMMSLWLWLQTILFLCKCFGAKIPWENPQQTENISQCDVWWVLFFFLSVDNYSCSFRLLHCESHILLSKCGSKLLSRLSSALIYRHCAEKVSNSVLPKIFTMFGSTE